MADIRARIRTLPERLRWYADLLEFEDLGTSVLMGASLGIRMIADEVWPEDPELTDGETP